MPEVIQDDLYNYPQYYDLVYGSDWKAEFDFLQECFERFAKANVKSVFEPACGTGRLLIKLAQAGFAVAGNDLNEHAVRYCNRRLKRNGYKETAVVGDMSDFALKRPVGAAFNMINSFRHLATEASAQAHLRCVANSLSRGGIYVLGMHLTPTAGDPIESESWPARRGNLAVISSLQTVSRDMKRRVETVAMTYDVYTPTRQFRLSGELKFRTYTARQMLRLIKGQPSLEIAAAYNFKYDIDSQEEIDDTTEDVVFVLRKT